MIVEPDHMSVRAKNRTLGILEQNDYSGVIASHSWSDPSAWPRIYRLGGLVTPITKPAAEFVAEWRELREASSRRFFFGMGFGADSNGLHEQPAPSGEPNVGYPFESFDGGTTFDRQQSGRRVWDVNSDGVDHYGLHPDWVEDLRLQAGDRIVRDLGRGAEAYLQMWERAVGVPAERCRAERDRFRTVRLGALHLGDSPTAVLRKAGQPTRRPGRSFRYCVSGKRNEGTRVRAVFAGGRGLGLIATEAPGYNARGVNPGDRAGRIDGATEVGNGLHVDRTRRGTAFVYKVRGGEVRAVGVATDFVAGSASRLKRHMRAAY
jgi:hypothetical protein